MTLQAVLDAVATKAKAVEGIKAAYSAGAVTGTLVIPSDFNSTPAALSTFSGMPELSPGSHERVTWRVELRIYINRANLAAAYRELAKMPERFLAAWRSDIDLGGTCTHSRIDGMGEPEEEEINGKPFLVLPVYVLAKTVSGRTYTA